MLSLILLSLILQINFVFNYFCEDKIIHNIQEIKNNREFDITQFVNNSDNVVVMGCVGCGKSFQTTKIIKSLNKNEVLYVGYPNMNPFNSVNSLQYSNIGYFYHINNLIELNENVIKDFYDAVYFKNIKHIVFDEFAFYNPIFNNFFFLLLRNLRKEDVRIIIDLQTPYNSEKKDFFEINNSYTKNLRELLSYFDKAFLITT